ncbi:hypothetical protein ACQJBY_036084 [Aegilops geniculata]
MTTGRGEALMTMQTTTTAGVDSALVRLRVDYGQFMAFPAGKALSSDVVSVGGQLWRIDIYPGGIRNYHKHVSIYLKNLSKSTCAKAIFEPFFLEKDGSPSPKITKHASVCENFASINNDNYCFGVEELGYAEFFQRSSLERYVVDGHFTFLCSIVVVNELGPVPVPPSDIRDSLGHLLEGDETTSDVSFIVDAETFHAHRVILAARSPVFKAQLFGSMLEATTTSSTPIVLHEIAPSTFKAMLRFMYTDAWPEDADGDESSSVEMFQDLLAAADLYALDRLKLMCARKLWDNVSVHTAVSILVCAEMYGCPELKNKCLDFCTVGKNFKEVTSTDGYAWLELRFPSIAAEIVENFRR